MNCKNCGAEFYSQNGLNIFCSDRCRIAAYKDKLLGKVINVKCEFCGVDFEKRELDTKKRFCGKVCSRNAYADAQKAQRRELYNQKLCPFCGTLFTPWRGMLYCSKECGRKHREMGFSEERKEKIKQRSLNYYYNNWSARRDYRLAKKDQRTATEMMRRNNPMYKDRKRKSDRESMRRAITELSDRYVRGLLCGADRSKMPASKDMIPQSLVDAYREVIKIKRLIKKQNNGND